MPDKEMLKLAQEIEQETEIFCYDCFMDYQAECLDEITEEEMTEDCCSNCEMVVAYNPQNPEMYSIDGYQYLTRITGMVILPIPVTKEEVLENLDFYEEMTDKQKELYSQRVTPWDFRYLEEE